MLQLYCTFEPFETIRLSCMAAAFGTVDELEREVVGP